jgi:hypothetical protein
MSKVVQKQIQRRSQIIEKLIPKLKDTPFDQLSVADICEAADISIGSFYHYFKTKSDLLKGLMVLLTIIWLMRCSPSLIKENELEISNSLPWLAQYINKHGLERSKLISSIKTLDVDIWQQASNIKKLVILLRKPEKGSITGNTAQRFCRNIYSTSKECHTDWSMHDEANLYGKMNRLYVICK